MSSSRLAFLAAIIQAFSPVRSSSEWTLNSLGMSLLFLKYSYINLTHSIWPWSMARKMAHYVLRITTGESGPFSWKTESLSLSASSVSEGSYICGMNFMYIGSKYFKTSKSPFSQIMSIGVLRIATKLIINQSIDAFKSSTKTLQTVASPSLIAYANDDSPTP